jgi:hypothetical protein
MSIHALNDTDFIAEFESGAIALADWDHRGHVRYGWIALQSEPRFERAMDRIRSGLKTHLMRAIESGETPEFGYHETITRFWLLLVDQVRREDPGHSDSGSFCEAHPELLDKHLLGKHYSKPLLLSSDSRCGYVEPDLAPLRV